MDREREGQEDRQLVRQMGEGGEREESPVAMLYMVPFSGHCL